MGTDDRAIAHDQVLKAGPHQLGRVHDVNPLFAGQHQAKALRDSVLGQGICYDGRKFVSLGPSLGKFGAPERHGLLVVYRVNIGANRGQR